MDSSATQAAETAEGVTQVSSTISWHQPHPQFVILLVGKDEIPFGIQKDLLVAQSPFYREEFAKPEYKESVEHIVNLPNSTVETFGCVQNFIYTGNLYDAKAGVNIPDYPLLMEIWKLATELKMAPLRSAVLAVMAERRQLTQSIPGTDLLKQAWKETEEGSGLRKMLIEWAAEHMRGSPDVRNTFAKSLPQEILSELVIVMSDLPNTPTIVPRAINKHYLNNQNEAEYESPYAQPPQKRPRKSEAATAPNGDDTFEVKHTVKKPSRKSEPVTRKPAKFHGRTTNNSASSSAPAQFANDSDRDLAFCRDLITRMLSGPGFWTRLVGHFKDPVDPVAHNAPNYFSVVKRPMDLKQIKAKMDRNEYASSAEFEADVRLIFQNCYEYWTQSDQVFKDCENFERYFNEKWEKRNKWVPPTVKIETID
ncbi:Bromodomain-containing protein [Glarea lozoyensis ATCC 20868]|uniref:Bromodomain-containing protein n=1 Tax=Glarea lozoyensis (strain ATCC 20868 / MF5171) TaxID=1116229 RepID=S3D2L8_GLAL2|nr:Bromodomain-containing protein [Glarea lozoyensis ATCC 20868]EPE31399.1 Bromodomain-containing protein [Glarea lozoyensis ATCC 20868]